jgi:hypothetical protein
MGFCAVWLLRPTVGSLVVVGTCARKEWKEKGRERDICGGRGGGEVASLWTLSNDCKLFDSKLPVVLYSVLYIAPLPDMVALFLRIASSLSTNEMLFNSPHSCPLIAQQSCLARVEPHKSKQHQALSVRQLNSLSSFSLAPFSLCCCHSPVKKKIPKPLTIGCSTTMTLLGLFLIAVRAH